MNDMLQYRLRYMLTTDISNVVRIDQQAFPAPWSVQAYVHEVRLSLYSHMLIVEQLVPRHPSGPMQSAWWALTGQPRTTREILSYGGLWHLGNEGHISTVASAPAHRRQGWGELALLAMLLRMINLGIGLATLEVRVSNTPAQTLYRRYGFVERGVKQEYYADNFEDAYDMALDLTDATHLNAIHTRFLDYAARLSIVDSFTDTPRPPLSA